MNLGHRNFNFYAYLFRGEGSTQELYFWTCSSCAKISGPVCGDWLLRGNLWTCWPPLLQIRWAHNPFFYSYMWLCWTGGFFFRIRESIISTFGKSLKALILALTSNFWSPPPPPPKKKKKNYDSLTFYLYSKWQTILWGKLAHVWHVQNGSWGSPGNSWITMWDTCGRPWQKFSWVLLSSDIEISLMPMLLTEVRLNVKWIQNLYPSITY